MNNHIGTHGEVGQCRLLFKSLIDRHTAVTLTYIGLVFCMYCMTKLHP